MIRTLRTRLLIGLTPLLALMVGLGLWAIVMFSRLGNNIDVILKENYRSVLAAEGMKEALERMDSALPLAVGGEEKRVRDQFAEYRQMLKIAGTAKACCSQEARRYLVAGIDSGLVSRWCH